MYLEEASATALIAEHLKMSAIENPDAEYGTGLPCAIGRSGIRSCPSQFVAPFVQFYSLPLL